MFAQKAFSMERMISLKERLSNFSEVHPHQPFDFQNFSVTFN